MTTFDGAADPYNLLLAVNSALFERGNFDAACHALAAALHCAAAGRDLGRLDEVREVAQAQQGHIDTHQPGARLSTAWAHQRGAKTVYEAVARQAGTYAEIERTRQAVAGSQARRAWPRAERGDRAE